MPKLSDKQAERFAAALTALGDKVEGVSYDVVISTTAELRADIQEMRRLVTQLEDILDA